ncbi:MAG: GH116 family glycosyl hydrolase [bacterium]|nr:GH116 family glycosyl hydrolase [bacterium]
MWAWEGSNCAGGCCHGSCTHVWNYAQALPHLFPALERTLRQTEFHENQDDRGHQAFRANLPISPVTDHSFHAAADGQLGGIMKVYRDWRISGDTAWLRALWPQVKQSLAFCIEQWDPGHEGVLKEPHHNTYDIEFWGPDPLCTTIYLGALKAAAAMARALGDDSAPYAALYAAGRRYLETRLFNGEYFFQQVQWENLRTPPPCGQTQMWNVQYSPEALQLLQREGPKYQYGTGCLSDGVLGAWLALVCGVGAIADEAKITKHLRAIMRHNFRRHLGEHTNPQRPQYARNNEGGVLVCTWPRGGALSLPLPYSDEVWTGIEYQVAAHCIMQGLVRDGLRIVRTCRARYDGRTRNPFDELECGHWYARALASYALLQACSGARYDAVEQTLHLDPPTRGDCRAFLCSAAGYGTVGVRRGKPFCKVSAGTIPVRRIIYRGIAIA